jgi:hypothetical protein
MSDELTAALVVLAAAIGFAGPVVLLVAAGWGASEVATLAAAGEPTPVIEFVCCTSIVFSYVIPR